MRRIWENYQLYAFLHGGKANVIALFVKFIALTSIALNVVASLCVSRQDGAVSVSIPLYVTNGRVHNWRRF